MFVYEIVEATHGKLISGDRNSDIQSFTQDSRQVKEGGMYIPLKGERFDGHDFIDNAFENGAKAIITSQDVYYPDKIIIQVEDTLQALKDMALYLRKHRDVKVVGITGSVGKTSTRDMVYSVVKQKYKTLKTEGNYNNEIGLPLTILRYQEEEVMVLEMGMNHLKEMSRLSKIALPDVAVITNVGTAHIGELGSRENILKAKLEITDGMDDDSVLIINQDNDMLATVDIPRLKVVRVGKDKGSQIKAKNIVLNETTSHFVVEYDGKGEKIVVPVQGEHNISNALLAIAVGLELNIDMEDIKKGIQEFELTKNRMDILEKENHVTVIDGTYNASVDSMKSSLDILSHYKRRKVAILADMLELGTYSETLHREVGQYVADKDIDVFVCVGKDSYYMYDQAKKQIKECYFFDNNQLLIEQIHHIVQAYDVVLIKGSHSMNLKEVVSVL
ncbi:MAG: UDP-N-acetylmuramoyl-tripeptide--D-alanyl-D-alanine ligase [Faecalibacillus sp.]